MTHRGFASAPLSSRESAFWSRPARVPREQSIQAVCMTNMSILEIPGGRWKHERLGRSDFDLLALKLGRMSEPRAVRYGVRILIHPSLSSFTDQQVDWDRSGSSLEGPYWHPKLRPEICEKHEASAGRKVLGASM